MSPIKTAIMPGVRRMDDGRIPEVTCREPAVAWLLNPRISGKWDINLFLSVLMKDRRVEAPTPRLTPRGQTSFVVVCGSTLSNSATRRRSFPLIYVDVTSFLRAQLVKRLICHIFVHGTYVM
jgi:hypothetical protein